MGYFRDNLKISTVLQDFDFTSTTTLLTVSSFGQLSTFDFFSGEQLSTTAKIEAKPTPYSLHSPSTMAYSNSTLLLSPTTLHLYLPDHTPNLYLQASTFLSKFTCLCLESSSLDYGLPSVTSEDGGVEQQQLHGGILVGTANTGVLRYQMTMVTK